MKISEVQIGDLIHAVDNTNDCTIAATVVEIAPCAYQYPIWAEFKNINGVSIKQQLNYSDIITNITLTTGILTEL